MTTITNPIRRTLVLTVGDLADSAGQMIEAKLTEEQGVETAVAIISAHSDTGNDSDFTAQLTETLTRISPPNLSQTLSAAGWQLVEPRMMHLMLFVDIVPGVGQSVQALGETAVATIYRHLGLDSKVTLIWLTPDMNEDTETCLQASFSFAPQVIALSLLNEDGLRLPETETLSHTASLLFWGLTGTPFFQYLAESLAAIDDVYTGKSPVTSLGIAEWGWSQTAVYEALIQRWRENVFSSWLTSAKSTLTPEIISTWLQQQKLDRESVKAAITQKRFPPAPDYERTARHWPWPWALNKQIVRIKERYQADGENIAVFKKNAEQQLQLLKEEADEKLAAFLTTLLDTQPKGGIDTALNWTWALKETWDALYEQIQDEAATYDTIDQNLAEERGLIDGEIREWQEGWPGGPWSRWLPHSWRVWHWPQLAWQYWQLRKLGLRLAGILVQQSGRRRQKAVDSMVAKTMSELARQGRQWHGKVEEIQDMLKANSKQDSIAEGKESVQPDTEDLNAEENLSKEAKNEHSEMEQVESLQIRSLQLDLNEEAKAAASAIGGLGEQLRLLDDLVLQNLDEVAEERLQAVWVVTAVDLLESLHTTPDAWQTWWQNMSHMAAPLWCYDEGLLSEAERRYQWTGTCVLGAGVERLPDLENLIHDNGSLPPDTPISRIPSTDHSRLLVIRIRHGVTIGSRMVNYER